MLLNNNTQFVRILYSALPDRHGESTGMAFGAGRLSDDTMTRYQVFISFINSPEFGRIATRYGVVS